MREPRPNAASDGGRTSMRQSRAGRRRAWPCRDASMTAWEQTVLTVGFAATTRWSKVRTVAGRMAIAKVSQ